MTEDTEEMPVGEWVSLVGHQLDHDDGVLAELDVELSDDVLPDGYSEYPMVSDGEHDAPHDLLWHGGGDYSIVPRSQWRKREPMLSTADFTTGVASEELRGLVEKWREEIEVQFGDRQVAGMNQAFEACADDLEQLLDENHAE